MVGRTSSWKQGSNRTGVGVGNNDNIFRPPKDKDTTDRREVEARRSEKKQKGRTLSLSLFKSWLVSSEK